jgi:signal peptidase I
MAKTLDQLRSEQRKKGSATPSKGKPAAQAKAKQPQHPEHHQSLGEIALSWVKTLGGAIVMVMILNGLLIASFVVPTGSMESTVMTGDFLFVNKLIYAPSTPQLIPIFNIPLPYYRFPGLREPRKGDVIVFIFPGNRDESKPQEFQYYLKRCVATAGDAVEIRNKRLYINGTESTFPPEGKFGQAGSLNPDDYLYTFPVGKGYNRDNYGPVKVPKRGDIINISLENLQEWDTFIRREGHTVATEGTTILIDGNPTTQYTVQRDYCFGMGDNRDNSLDSRYWGFIPVDNVVGTPLVVYWSWETNLIGDSYFGTLIEKFKTIRFNRIGKVIH